MLATGVLILTFSAINSRSMFIPYSIRSYRGKSNFDSVKSVPSVAKNPCLCEADLRPVTPLRPNLYKLHPATDSNQVHSRKNSP